MGQLVGQQVPSIVGVGRVPSFAEHDVLPECVGQGLNAVCRLRGGFAGMNPDAAEVMPETRFQLTAKRLGQWLAGAPGFHLSEGYLGGRVQLFV